MKNKLQINIRPFLNLIKRLGFWFIVIILILISIPHYREALEHPDFLTQIIIQLNLNRHAFERILFLIPITYAGFIFGWKGAVITSITTLLIMLPRVLFLTDYFSDSLFETIAVFIVGNIVAMTFVALRKEREHRIHLSVLDKIATAVSQSLELSQILKASIDSVMSVMGIDGVIIYLTNSENENQLRVASYRGFSRKFIEGIDRLKIGEGLNGSVALTGRPEYIEDVLSDSRLTKNEAVQLEGVKSSFIVPLKSKNSVMGTLCLVTKTKYQFKKEEMETAIAIGNEIGVAVENARIYEKQKEMQESLRFYLHQVTQAQEEERKRIARELHDDTIQSLVVLARHIDEITYNGNELSIEKKQQLDKLRDETNNIMAGIRRLSQDLRPPTLDKLGLIPAIEWLASSIEEISGIPVKFKIEGIERRFPAEVELVLYRVIQEALRNVWRHSSATQAEVIIEFRDNNTRIEVSDNGRGLDFSHPTEDLTKYGKLGLAGIKERARLLGGKMDLESKPGAGTRLTIEAPI